MADPPRKSSLFRTGLSTLSSSRFLFLLFPLLVSGCGFAPVHGTSGHGQNLQNQLSIASPTNSDAFILVQELESRLGRNGDRYRLNYGINVGSERTIVAKAGDTIRYHLVGIVNYTLIDSHSNAIVAQGQTQNFTGYSTTGSTVETRSAEDSARERLMRILAEQVAKRLYAAAAITSS